VSARIHNLIGLILRHPLRTTSLLVVLAVLFA
jgi:hypothetical protein